MLTCEFSKTLYEVNTSLNHILQIWKLGNKLGGVFKIILQWKSWGSNSNNLAL